MWPFKKKPASPDQLPVAGPWSVGVRQHEGQVMIVRSNTGYRRFSSVPGYEHQAGIAVPLRDAQPNGLPSPAEDAELTVIEDAIRTEFQQEGESLLVAIITTGGMREFVLYTRAPQQLQQRFEKLRDGTTDHEIQLMVQLDESWEIYRQLG